MTHLACHFHWSEMSGSTRIHSSHQWTDRHERGGPAGKYIKTALAGGEGKDTNRDMIRGEVSLCATMCGRQKKKRERDTGTRGRTLQYDKWVEGKGSVVAACVVDSDGR